MYPPPGKQQSAPREYFKGSLLNFLNRQYECAIKNWRNAGLVFMHNFISVKPGLHVVVTIGHHAYARVLKMVLKLSTYRLQIFLVKCEYLRSLCEDQGIRVKLKKPVRKHVLAILTTYIETRL